MELRSTLMVSDTVRLELLPIFAAWGHRSIAFTIDYAAAVATYDLNGRGNFDSAVEVKSALATGDAVDSGVVASFACPVIKL
jgi:hypothetical protein